MQIKRHNLVDGVFETVGPHVVFELAEAGQANTMIHVELSDGTHLHFPDGTGPAIEKSTVLPAGDHDVGVLIAAFGHGDFGRVYKTQVKVAGIKVATAAGTLPDGEDADSAFQHFVLRVRS